MEELNQHKTPLERASENTEANEKICRPGRLGPVRPLSPTGQTGRAGVQKPRPVSETGQTGCTQTDRKQSFKRQILSKRSPNPTKLGGKLRTYLVNISTRDLTLKIFKAREFRDEIKRGGVFSRPQKLQF